MRKSSRVILISPDNELILMKRFKNGETYYTTVGGGVEAGESSVQAAKREVLEETGYNIDEPRLAFHFDDTERQNSVDFYVAHTLSQVTPNGSEWTRQCAENHYAVVALFLSEARTVDLRPAQIKEQILSVFKKAIS